ncbi:MAG: hypothetical protein JO270_09395 [Acidobacteriaceae bacterium]|nr:hypothetical protein [Acidobacteriaceae bacterium]
MKYLAALTIAAVSLANSASAAQQDTKSDSPDWSVTREYRASAYISLLSLTIFSRSGVGSGFASMDTRRSGDERVIKLRFLAGSDPQRAHGLNRLGYIEESVREKHDCISHAYYFGVMTSSAEQSLEQAKASLETSTGATVPYVASRASSSGDRSEYTLLYMRAPSSYSLSNAAELVHLAEARFQVSGNHSVTKQYPSEAGPFLYTLVRALRAGSSRVDTQFLYNGTMFRLVVEKKPDHKAGEEFERAGLITSAASVQQAVSTIHNPQTNSQTAFRVWFDPSSADVLPLRFEFRPRSFLRLVFDAQQPARDAAAGQALSLNKVRGEGR